jgi:crotonobetaine/carnitine-CoA ligase
MSLSRTIPDLDPVEQRTVAAVLARNLRERPDQPAVIDYDGQLTYRELYDAALVFGGGFGQAGVEADATVLLMLDNHIDYIVAWLGLNLIGAIEVPVNTAYRGAVLAHVANDSGARAAVVESGYLERFLSLKNELQHLERVFVRGHDGPLPEVPGWVIEPFETIRAAQPAEPVDLHPWTRIGLLYTSGTTGPSKGVAAPQGLAWSYSAIPWIEAGQRIMVNLPLFHVGGQWAGVYAAFIAGGTGVIIPRFSASTFFDDVRRFRCDQTLLLGAMASFLWGRPPRDDDRDHTMRNVNMVPVLPNHEQFAERFGITIGSAYGLTEFSSPIFSLYGEGEPGLAGWVRDDFEARIVDEFDLEVPPGATGELCLRAKVPWANMDGYHNLPGKTQEAWRNLWFHTGDAMRQDEQGRFHFIDRINDALRVRGENVSSFEVEAEIVRHPAVLACAVVAVPSEHTEDEIKAVVVLKEGKRIDLPELLEDLTGRLPYFMVPRYYDVVAELPVTPTAKIKKAELRASGITDSTWDCVAQGYQVTRNGLVRPEGEHV